MTGLSLRQRVAPVPPDRLLLFLDYDGTLTPIARRPGEARLSEPVRRLLLRLAQSIPVVIVSGRELADLRRMVRLPGLRYVGTHGLLYHEPGASERWLGEPSPDLEVRRWIEALETAAAGISGALIETKIWSVALHDRLVSARDRRRLRQRVLKALSQATDLGKIALVQGKRVMEVRPAGAWNKGLAVATLLAEHWAAGRFPVYIGDDRTDFDAFAILRGRGIAARVGGRRRIAGEDAWLENPAAVESFLRWLADRLDGRRVQRTVRPARAAVTAPDLTRLWTSPEPAAGPVRAKRALRPGPAGDFDVPP